MALNEKYLVLLLFWLLAGCNEDSRRTNSVDASVVARIELPSDYVTSKDVVSIKFPEFATNVYYYERVEGMQDLELYLRFEVPDDRIDETVSALLDESELRMSKASIRVRKDIEAGIDALTGRTAHALGWWSIKGINRGFYVGQLDSYSLRICVDQDHGRFYVYSTD
mgnify:CR=1 FL=1